MKLDLGAGEVSPEGFTPLGNINGTTIFPLPQADGSVEEIRASHVLEHFPFAQVPAVLKDWARALRPGGRMRIAVPDFAKIAENYLAGRPQNTQGYVMGGQTDAADHHRALFDEEQLRQRMSDAGLVLLRPWSSDIKDCAALDISLNLEGYKPHVRQLKIYGVMSAPRLGFNEMWNCAMRFLPDLGVRLRKVGGAFWGQALTKGIESILDEVAADYILTLDFDSVFNARAAAELIQLAMVYPEADAIAPLQASRHNINPLFSFHAPADARREGGWLHVPAEHFERPLVRLKTAHFGLTLLRADRLRALPKPWFAATPDERGGWGEGHVDDDTHFWRQWEKAGFTLFLAPRVAIGHMEVVVRWPAGDGRPLLQAAAEWENTLVPPAGVWGG